MDDFEHVSREDSACSVGGDGESPIKNGAEDNCSQGTGSMSYQVLSSIFKWG